MAAALVGIIVTMIHKRYHRDKPLTRSLMQAQVLLCVAGAMVMVIIGSSVARAFGVAGAAGIVRFRTPVEDPKDSTILFLLVGLGMACGVGLLEVAGLGTVFLCVVLAVLDRFGEAKSRQMVLSVVAAGSNFPSEHVDRVLGANVDYYEAREMVQGNEATVKYSVTLSPDYVSALAESAVDGGRQGRVEIGLVGGALQERLRRRMKNTLACFGLIFLIALLLPAVPPNPPGTRLRRRSRRRRRSQRKRRKPT